MTRNLQPSLGAPGASLERGLLLFIPDYNAKDRTYRALRFQYNPETVSRTRQGEWSSDRVRGAKRALPRQDRSLLDGHRGAGLFAKSETIDFKLIFDATEVVLRGGDANGNVLPEIGFLEQVALGGDEPMKTESKQEIKSKPSAGTKASVAGTDKGGAKTPSKKSKPKKKYKTKIHGTAPSELLLVLGPRTFPVVLTSLTIVEQRFSPDLEPIRAECDCKFRVLEVQEVKNNKPAEVAFTELMRTRKSWSEAAAVEDGDERVLAVVKSLEGKK